MTDVFDSSYSSIAMRRQVRRWYEEMASPLPPLVTLKIAQRATILFADDDADTCEMMKTLLRFEGYDVVTAKDGREAIEVARQKFPQLILLDLEIPKVDGIGVAKALKSERRFKGIPIVMISGHSPSKFRQRALDAGCDDYLLKPLDFSRIEELLARICSRAAQPERRHAAA